MKKSYPPLVSSSQHGGRYDHILYNGHALTAPMLVDIAATHGVRVTDGEASKLITALLKAVEAGATTESKAAEYIFDSLFDGSRQVRITFKNLNSTVEALRPASNAVMNTLLNNEVSPAVPAVPRTP